MSKKKKKIFEKKIKIVEYVDNKLYGFNNIDDEVLNASSEFVIGGVTKIFTIISLLLLHQNGKLNIYDTIGHHINNDHIKNLKILDIINHRSGLIRKYHDQTIGISKVKYKSMTEIYEKWNNNNIIDKNLIDRYSYSNVGYYILGVLID